MDTNSNIPAEKKVVSVEILHLDELGYGPQGKHTRREWRKECLENLRAGLEQFRTWQTSWKNQINANLPKVGFNLEVTYSDGSKSEDIDQRFESQNSYSLDFAAHIFGDNLNCEKFTFQQVAVFRRATFNGSANFQEATCSGSVDFRSALFSNTAYFGAVTFSEEVYFTNATFRGAVYFNSTIFGRLVSFFNSSFLNEADFSHAIFNEVTDFSNAAINGPADFNSASFGKEVNFKSLTFRNKVNFSNSMFNRYSDFKNTVFKGDANFRSAAFKGNTGFSNSTFSEEVNFRSATFSEVAFFMHVTFSRYANFKSAAFGGNTNFSNAAFSEVATFSNAQFSGHANFSSAVFSGQANFSSAIFIRHSYFRRSTFSGIAYFIGVEFKSDTAFSSAEFKKHAVFSSVEFNGYAVFSDSMFNADANFNNVLFIQDANFSNCKFNGDSYYIGARFSSEAKFVKSKFNNQLRFDFDPKRKFLTESLVRETFFMGAVNFENAEIQNVGHFERVNFNGEMPNFLGVDNAKTLLVFSGDKYFAKNDITEDAVKRIGQLKRLSDEQGQTDQALMFNAFELNAKAKQPDASCIFKVLTWLYEKVSNYGRSFGRPLLTYLGLVSITYTLALFAAAHNSPQDCKGEFWRVFSDMRDNGWPSCLSAELPDDKLKLNGYRAALEYTTYRAAGILDFSDNDKQTVAVSKRLFNADVEPTWMRFWGIFKAIASAALLFLAALGLRNKYRIK